MKIFNMVDECFSVTEVLSKFFDQKEIFSEEESDFGDGDCVYSYGTGGLAILQEPEKDEEEDDYEMFQDEDLALPVQEDSMDKADGEY